MKLETDVDQLQIQKAKIEQLLESQKLKINSKFDAELESQFWKDREDRLIKMIVRAIRPAIIIFIIFELISLPLNYLTTTEYQNDSFAICTFVYRCGLFQTL